MAIPLYTDVHVHDAIVEALRLRGIDVRTAREDDADGLEDDVLLDRATTQGRVLLTYDDDFLKEAQRRQSTGEPFSGIIYSHQRDVRVGSYVRQLELIATAMSASEMRNRVLFLPL